jgi:protease-4
MSLETDLLLDRRRLKRRLFLWRVLALLALVVAGLAWAGRGAFLPATPYVARLRVDGLITDDRQRIEEIAAAARNDQVRALILSVNSPGGSVAGGERLHGALAAFAAHKPVVTVMHGLAASAGYMIAMPSDRIFASAATLTGSIGVLLQSAEMGGLLGKVGIGAETIVSGPLKDQPSFTHPLSPEGRSVLTGIVMDLYDQFVSMVAAGRHMDVARVRELGDGRAYTGRQALALGLIDQIGGEAEARAWLAAEKHVPTTLPVRELRSESLQERLVRGVSGLFAGLVRAAVGGMIGGAATPGPAGAQLDGAMALWQP